MIRQIDKVHLRGIEFFIPEDRKDEYPFSVPAINAMQALSLDQSVTIFVGENGSGKSTLLEAMARAIGIITVGKEMAAVDTTLEHVQPLVDKMKLIWNQKTHRGFFLRAEDFFGYIQELRNLKQQMIEEMKQIDHEYQGRSSYAKLLAKGPVVSSITQLQTRYGRDLDANSHGESFLALFKTRFVPGGLFLLDEPEAALSPIGQLGLISLMKTMVKEEAQFIIATHSPILMAISGAVIFDFDQCPAVPVSFDALEHVRLYRSFLEDPEAFVQRL